MKYFFRICLILLVLMSGTLIAAESQEPVANAKEVIKLLSQENFQTVYDRFDDTIKSTITLEKLQQLWQGIVAQCGPLKNQISSISQKTEQGGREYDVTLTTCEFEKSMIIDIQIAFDSSGKIVGIYFRPGKGLKAAAPKRPQVPLKPYPYDEKEVTFENLKSKVKLAGTLTLPQGRGKFPAVVLISGSGSQDRDETILGHKPFLVLADYLTRRGIAVLRVDDRGEGGSAGDHATATSEDLAGDVLAGIEFLKKQPKINSLKIGLLGHSEGGTLALLTAGKSKSVAFIVMMASPGLPGDQILISQLEATFKASGKSDAIIKTEQTFQKNVFAIVKQEKDKTVAEAKLREVFTKYIDGLPEAEKKILGNPENYIKLQIQSLLQPFMRFYISYDPRTALRKLKCPVLAVCGGKDLQVDPKANLAAIRIALKNGGNLHFLVKELPGLNHLFQTCQTGLPDEIYKIEETIAPVALKTMGDWIVTRTKNK